MAHQFFKLSFNSKLRWHMYFRCQFWMKVAKNAELFGSQNLSPFQSLRTKYTLLFFSLPPPPPLKLSSAPAFSPTLSLSLSSVHNQIQIKSDENVLLDNLFELLSHKPGHVLAYRIARSMSLIFDITGSTKMLPTFSRLLEQTKHKEEQNTLLTRL